MAVNPIVPVVYVVAQDSGQNNGNSFNTGFEVYGLDLKTGNLSAIQFVPSNGNIIGSGNGPKSPIAVSVRGDFLYWVNGGGRLVACKLNADGTLKVGGQLTAIQLSLGGTKLNGGQVTSLAPTLDPGGNNVVVFTTNRATNNVGLVFNSGAALIQTAAVQTVGNVVNHNTVSSASLFTQVINGSAVTTGLATVAGQRNNANTALNNLALFVVTVVGNADTLAPASVPQQIGFGIGNLNGDPTTVSTTNNAGQYLAYVTTNAATNNVALFVPVAAGFQSGTPNQVTTAPAASTTIASLVDQSSRFLVVVTDQNTLNIDLFEIAQGGVLDVPSKATAGSIPAGVIVSTLTQ